MVFTFGGYIYQLRSVWHSLDEVSDRYTDFAVACKIMRLLRFSPSPIKQSDCCGDPSRSRLRCVRSHALEHTHCEARVSARVGTNIGKRLSHLQYLPYPSGTPFLASYLPAGKLTSNRAIRHSTAVKSSRRASMTAW